MKQRVMVTEVVVSAGMDLRGYRNGDVCCPFCSAVIRISYDVFHDIVPGYSCQEKSKCPHFVGWELPGGLTATECQVWFSPVAGKEREKGYPIYDFSDIVLVDPGGDVMVMWK